ncbi:MAG: sialate O-acetylesterase [Patescibacteria group bacterium]
MFNKFQFVFLYVALISQIFLSKNVVAAGEIITISTPKSYQVVQRDNLNKATITISGTYTGTPTAIEASWNDGAYATIVASPTGGTFSGSLTNQSTGQGLLSVRFVNDTTISTSTAYVGVGDVYFIAGQSNFSGRGFNNQVYTHPTLKAALFGNDDQWKELIDPTDSNVNRVDSISSDGVSASGSLWPLVATRIMAKTNVPVAFVTGSKGGTSITEWQPAYATSTLYGSMYRRINAVGGVKAILFFQGETDVANHMLRATYLGYLNTMVDTIFTDFGVKTVVGQIANSANVATSTDAIRLAQIDAWNNNSHVIGGAAYPDVNLANDGGDNLHFKTNDDLQIFADRFWASMDAGMYGGTDGRGPRLVSAKWGTTAKQIILTFTDESLPLLPINTTGGFSVSDSNGTTTIASSTRITGNQIKLTLANTPVGATTVSLASGSAGVGVNMPTDSSTYRLPAEIFINQVVSSSTDILAPVVEITSPTNNGTVSSSITITASSSDNVGVSGIQFMLDGNVLIGSEDITAPYSIIWNTALVSDGAHTIQAVARDDAVNYATSAPITITIQNTLPPIVYPTVRISSGGSGIDPSYVVPVPTLHPVQANPAPVKNTKTDFTRDLLIGKIGEDVKLLQKYLNMHGYAVASTGPGSKGKETTLFGKATQIALMKFQKKNNIVPASGTFGPKTRAVIEK